MAKASQARPASPSRSASYVGFGSSIAFPARRFLPERLRSAKFVRDMASACGSSITGSSAALSQRCNANQTRHTPLRLTTLLIDVCENGWQAPGIFIHHPQRKLRSRQHLGSAEVTHPFHPLRGHQFVVLKVRRVSGIDTLSLRHSELGSFAMPREWTDWTPPNPHVAATDGQPLITDAFGLVALNELVVSLT